MNKNKNIYYIIYYIYYLLSIFPYLSSKMQYKQPPQKYKFTVNGYEFHNCGGKFLQLLYGLSSIIISATTLLLVSNLNFIKQNDQWMNQYGVAECVLSSKWWSFRESLAWGQLIIHSILFIARFNSSLSKMIITILPTSYKTLVNICNVAIFLTVIIYLNNFRHSLSCMILSVVSHAPGSNISFEVIKIVRNIFIIDLLLVLYWTFALLYRLFKNSANFTISFGIGIVPKIKE